MRRVLFILGMLFVASNASGQRTPAPALDPGLRLTQYVHESWQVQDGLPQNAVYAVLQTRDGYLWLGTQEGLVRFDGTKFQVIGKGAAGGPKSSEIRALLEDRRGALWIGTNGGGISRYQNGAFTTYTTKDGLSSDLVRTLYEDRQGHLWVGTVDGGLSRFDGSTFTGYGPKEGLAGNVVLAITEDADGTLWVGTEGGLSRFNGGRFTNYTTQDGLPDNLIWALRTAPDGSLWAGTSGGLARVQNGRVTPHLPEAGACGRSVSTLYQDAAGALWLGTLDGGLCRFRDGRFESFSTHDGLTHDRVRSIYQDQESNLWIGTEGGGLNRLRRGKFASFSAAEGLSSNEVYTILEDRAGALWFGTYDGGLNRLYEGRIDRYSTENGLPGGHVYALHESRDGSLWVGMLDGGLCRLAGDRFTCFTAQDELASNNVYAIHEDRNGAVLIGTDAGLNRMAGGRLLPDADSALAHTPITALHEDRTGGLWIGTYGSGLVYRRGADVRHYSSAEGFAGDIVLAVHEDAAGTLWVGTQGGGLCRIAGGEAACMGSGSGLQTDNVLQIQEDAQGHLWLASNTGILRVRKQELEAYAAGRQKAVHPTVYGRADGLKRSEANGGTQPASWRSRDGRLWFSTQGGAAFIDPQNIPTNTRRPPVLVESVFADSTEHAAAGALTLGPGLKDVVFRYTALSFTVPEQVRFKYMLEGYDEDWIDAGTRREAYYTNLPPGQYRFLVKASNEDGLWNEQGAALAFHLRPHFYQTTWFALLSALAVLLAALAAYRMRVNQLKARGRELERIVDERTRDLRLEKERTEEAKAVIEEQAERLKELDRFKTRFFANISHEFRTPLTMIVGPLENLLHGTYGAVPDRICQQAEIMLRNGLRLLRLINQLLDLSKLEAGKMELRAQPRDLVSFLEGVVLSCTAFAERKHIELTFATEAGSSEMYYEPDKLEKVFFNLLSNALKFTPDGGRISVSLAETGATDAMPDGAVVVSVKDSGKGIPADQLAFVFDRFHQVDGSNTREQEGTGIGLSLARELVLLHHGAITVESEPGNGAEFIVTLPKGRAHLEPDEVVEDREGEPAEHGALTELATSAFDYMHSGDGAAGAAGVADAPLPEGVPLVLVADDNKDVREYVSGLLAEHFRVVTAADGKEALDRATDLVPDLIVSDVMMPVMDGNELCSRVKASPALSHIPVLLLTARATHQSRMEGLAAGADDHLAKPFNAEELLARIRNLLHLRRQERELKELNALLEEKVREQVEQFMRERSRYESDLIAAKEKAEASDRFKSAILDNMNHEIRTPLTAITGYAEIIGEMAPEDLREFTDHLRSSGERLLQTVSALLDLAQVTSHTLDVQAERIDASEIARDLAPYYERLSKAKGLSFELHLPVEPLEADLNAGCLRRVLAYLADNAVKFTETGHVRVRMDRAGEHLRLDVEDTGIGIGEAFLPRIFDEFTQESDGTDRRYEGTGLGLAITSRLVSMLGGTITVASRPGAGSTFTVLLPLRQRVEAEAQAA